MSFAERWTPRSAITQEAVQSTPKDRDGGSALLELGLFPAFFCRGTGDAFFSMFFFLVFLFSSEGLQ